MGLLGTLPVMRFLLVIAIVVGYSEASRGVVCKADSNFPSPFTNEQQHGTFDCAINCLSAGSSQCSSSGFAMEWNPAVKCVDKGAGALDFTCVAS